MRIIKYEYMVCYTIPNGSGRIFITLDKPVESYMDIENLDNKVKERTGLDNLFVSNFILLRKFKV